MILKIKVKLDEFNKHYPTSVFLIDGFINFYNLQPIIAEANDYIRTHDMSKYIACRNEVHFRIKEQDGMYINLGPTEQIECSVEDLEAYITTVTKMSIPEIFAKTRFRKNTTIRAVMYSALMYFKHMGSTDLMNKYGFDHATCLHSVNQTMPRAMFAKDTMATKLVGDIAARYGDNKFIDYCSEFRDIKPIAPKEPNKKYKGVWRERNRYSAVYSKKGRRKYIGSFTTPFAAAQAYDNYVKENNLNQ